MKRVKKVLIALLSLIMVASISFATGCFLLDSEDATSEVAIVMDKAVEKIDSISQLMFEAIDNANGQQANPLSSESNIVSPFSATESACLICPGDISVSTRPARLTLPRVRR